MEHLQLVLDHWPWLIWLVAAYFIVGCLSLTFEKVEQALGPLGRFWRMRGGRADAEIKELRRQVDFLSRRVEVLTNRDECYFSYLLWDTEYHRRQELLAAQIGFAMERHKTFLEFRDEWIATRGGSSESVKDIGFWS